MLLSFFHIRAPPSSLYSFRIKEDVNMERILRASICVIRVGTLVFTIEYGEIIKEGGSGCDDR